MSDTSAEFLFPPVSEIDWYIFGITLAMFLVGGWLLSDAIRKWWKNEAVRFRPSSAFMFLIWIRDRYIERPIKIKPRSETDLTQD